VLRVVFGGSGLVVVLQCGRMWTIVD
jgi:hypothetical protein